MNKKLIITAIVAVYVGDAIGVYRANSHAALQFAKLRSENGILKLKNDALYWLNETRGEISEENLQQGLHERIEFIKMVQEQ